MSPYLAASFFLALITLGHFLGSRRARLISGGKSGVLHSLPHYYGLYVALWTGVPSIILISLWFPLEPYFLDSFLISSLGKETAELNSGQLELLLNDNTIPFIARYRKEATGGLDEVQIAQIQDRY